MRLKEKAETLIDNAGEAVARFTSMQARINYAFILSIAAFAITLLMLVVKR